MLLVSVVLFLMFISNHLLTFNHNTARNFLGGGRDGNLWHNLYVQQVDLDLILFPFRYFFTSQHIELCRNASFWKERPLHCASRGLVPCNGNYPGFCTKNLETCRETRPEVGEEIFLSICPDKSHYVMCKDDVQCDGLFQCLDNRTCVPCMIH